MRKPMDRDPPRAGAMSSTAAGWRRPGGPATPGKVTRVESLAPVRPLAPPIRSKLEAAFGADLSAVRVGEDPSVAAMGARAHARGLHVMFAPGAYQPDTPEGEALIAHEVAHLVQQAERPVATTGHIGGVPLNTDRGLEREADALAARAMGGETMRLATPTPSTGPIQGMFDDIKELFEPIVEPVVDARPCHARPGRDAEIEQLRADISACETHVRTVLRHRATTVTASQERALWGKLADIAEQAGVFVDRTLTSYTIEHEDGTVTELDPANWLTTNFLNPGGFHVGGHRYDDATVNSALAEVYSGDPDRAAKSAATKKFIHTLKTNEGGPDSMNTWDGEIVSAGSGLSGGGRLQAAMFSYKTREPGSFHDELGKFGIDILKKGTGNPFFTVRVPSDVQAIPPAMRDSVTPGEVIIGSATTGMPKGGDKYQECAALRYISKDPVLLSRFMYAGKHGLQLFLIKEAIGSMQTAQGFSFIVGEQVIAWQNVIEPLGADWLAATQAVIAYRYHASAATYEKLKAKTAGFYQDNFGAELSPEELTTEQRKMIGRFIGWQLRGKKKSDRAYPAFRKEFSTVAAEVFPPAPPGKAKGKKGEKGEKGEDDKGNKPPEPKDTPADDTGDAADDTGAAEAGADATADE